MVEKSSYWQPEKSPPMFVAYLLEGQTCNAYGCYYRFRCGDREK